MRFRSELKMPSYPFRIEPNHQILAIGSCFAQEIGDRLQEHKFFVDLNPFGIQFNPSSVAFCLEMLRSTAAFEEKCLISDGDLWYSWMHHGSFAALSKQELLAHIDARLQHSRALLKRTDLLIITLGSAHAYIHNPTGKLVANCHKQPDKWFTKLLLPLKEMTAAWMDLIAKLVQGLPNLQILISVSPVRYWRDGAVRNQQSKARLLLLAERLVKAFSQCHYFPAYEWVIDDLRDYRFFAEDMAHPNPIAINYVWEKFQSSLMDPQSIQQITDLQTLHKMLSHRSIHPTSAATALFKDRLRETLSTLEHKYPHLDFSNEAQKVNLYPRQSL